MAGHTLPSTTFSWQNGSIGFTNTGSVTSGLVDANGYNDNSQNRWLGEGMLARQSNGSILDGGNSFWATTTIFSDAGGWSSGLRFFMMDMNGDGSNELVGRDSAGNLIVYHYNTYWGVHSNGVN